mmetsp:Transcript_8244/g.20746  ORF Transcript_8244/g.20746 Transcript_8244/m.20746 type:complete len:155 (-) Transcript_8244:130-594(-)
MKFSLLCLIPLFFELSVVAASSNDTGGDVVVIPNFLRSRRHLAKNGVGANQGSARKTPRGEKIDCDDSDFVIPGQTKTLKDIGSTALCGQPVTSCLWYIGLREIDCECGFGVQCPEQGDEFCFDGTTLDNGIGGGAKSDGSNGLRFWVCDLDEP